jgi:hypothetical protein
MKLYSVFFRGEQHEGCILVVAPTSREALRLGRPLLVDLFSLPTSADGCVVCTNVRTLAGKRPLFVDRSDSFFLFPLPHVRFVEIPASAAGEMGSSSGPARVEVQGAADLTMSFCGGIAAFGSGFVKQAWGFHLLADLLKCHVARYSTHATIEAVAGLRLAQPGLAPCLAAGPDGQATPVPPAGCAHSPALRPR